MVLIVFVMGSVLCSIHFEEAPSLVEVDSCTRNVDIWMFSHVIDFGGDKLNLVKFCCIMKRVLRAYMDYVAYDMNHFRLLESF